MSRLRVAALALCLAPAAALVAPFAAAQDDYVPGWIGYEGVEGFAWGSDAMPLDAVPRPRDFILPDSHYIGANKQDKPDDLEIRGPAGERRFVRYARGQPSRIRITADQPTFDLEDCVAAALMELVGAPNASGTLELMRFQ